MADVDVTPSGPITNVAKLAGEFIVVPGISLVADGDVKGGAIHAGAAIGAGMLLGPILGPIGVLAAALNSYSRSVSGRNIHQHFTKKFD